MSYMRMLYSEMMHEGNIYGYDSIPCNHIQYNDLIPAPVDRVSASAWLYKQPWITCDDDLLQMPCMRMRYSEFIHEGNTDASRCYSLETHKCIGEVLTVK